MELFSTATLMGLGPPAGRAEDFTLDIFGRTALKAIFIGAPYMRERHVVLKSSIALSPNATQPTVVPAAITMPTEVSLHLEYLSRPDVPILARQNDVLAIAPAMPMNLFEPTDSREPSASEASTTAWGVRAIGADTSSFSGAGICVAVLDTGIDKSHPAFEGMDLVLKNFTEESDEDIRGHGTHCAGTIFGRPVGGTRIGVAPGVKRALIGKVLGSGGGSSDQIASAIQWAAENGATVISMSLGIDFPAYAALLERQGLPSRMAVSRALEGYRANVLLFEKLAQFLKVRTQTTLIVAAAGNESDRYGNPSLEIGVSPPAVSDGIISVAALEDFPGGLRAAGFSNTGANVAAPGVNIMSAALKGGLRVMSGTSMATPHVAGAAALWAERTLKLGALSTVGLTARVIGTASLKGFSPGFDPFDIGAGLVTSPQE